MLQLLWNEPTLSARTAPIMLVEIAPKTRRLASPCRFGTSRYFDAAGGADEGLGGTTFVVNKRTFQPSLSCSKTMLQRPTRDSAPLGPWPDRLYSPNAHAAFPARCA